MIQKYKNSEQNYSGEVKDWHLIVLINIRPEINK